MNAINFRDTLTNLVAGLGVANRDKSMGSRYVLGNQFDREQQESAYRSDWIARKVVDIPAKDSTREWRAWQADKKDITRLEDEESRLGVKKKLRDALIRARLYGGAAMILGVDGDDPSQELIADRIGQQGLSYVHVVSRHDVTAAELNFDITSGTYCEPIHYDVQSKTGSVAQRIHPSRVVPLVGAELPDKRRENTVWGDSSLQAVDETIKHVGLCSGGIAALVWECKLDVIKIPGLMAGLAREDYKERLLDRVALANEAKSFLNALLMDKEEDWTRIQQNFSGLPDVLKLYLLIASGAADIPVTRFLGQSPAGMNATGESDTRNYYDRIKSDQTNDLQPALARLDEVLIRSALGARPPELHYNWVSLWQMDDAQRADLAHKKAQVFAIDVGSGAVPLETMGEVRVNQLIEDGTYPGLEEAVADGERGEEDLDESDPEVQAQATGAPLAAEPAKQALNGAQISSLLEIVEAIRAGHLPPESAKVVLAVSYPSISSAEISAIVDPIEVEEKKDPPPPPFSPFGQRAAPPVPPPPDEDDEPMEEAMIDGARVAIDDGMEPRPLYVRRDVVNKRDVVRWAKSQGFSSVVDDLHVTLLYSKRPVDWIKMGEGYPPSDNSRLTVSAGGPRVVKPLGDDGAVVLLLASSQLCWRHEEMVRAGASHDYPEYQPHVTITYEKGDVDLDTVVPYRGEIVLGPEIFEEIGT